MIKKMMAIVSVAAFAGAGSLVAPTTAKASGPSDYAVEQCGNGGWEELQYPTYEACYTAAVQFYFEQTGGGGSGSGSSGGGGTGAGGSVIPGLPTWSGCEGTRLPCNPSN